MRQLHRGVKGLGVVHPFTEKEKSMFWLGSPAIVSKLLEMCHRDALVIPNMYVHKLNRLIYIMFFIVARLINYQFPGYRC